MPGADVIVLGEVHDNPHHHDNQAEAVALIRPAAIVFEMLTADQASRVTPELIGERERLAEVLDWSASGWPDFAMYHPIFAAAPTAEVFGAGVPRAEVARAIEQGAAAVFGPEAVRFGLDRPYPPETQQDLEAEQQAVHCDALPPEMLPGFVEAQRLRDAELARQTLLALEKTGGPVVVITGNGHARTDLGLVPYLLNAAPATSVISIGQFEVTAESDPPFDFWIVTPAAERGDPCEAFR